MKLMKSSTKNSIKTLLTVILIVCFNIFGYSRQPFRFIVAADGTGDFTSIQAAMNSCPEGEQSLIFIKNGTYAEQVSLGTKAASSSKKISLIGESRDGVVITHSQSRRGSGSPTFEDICTVKLYATDFYAENITIENTAGNTGMAEALYTAGDRQTFKNCRILGYQDTYRSKKGTRGYFKDSWIEGAVDFIYAGGSLIFDDCTINCVKGGGYITAPEDAFAYVSILNTEIRKTLRLSFLFRNCSITANEGVPENSYYLGRPWNVNAGTFYLNCYLGNHIRPIGWQTWNGNETSASFAEYNSMDLSGNPVDVSSRATWSFQLPKNDVDKYLTPEFFYSKGYTTPYDPISICISPEAPVIISSTNDSFSWNPVSNAIGYLIFKNGSFLTVTTNTTYTDNSEEIGTYSIKSIGNLGVLSDASNVTTDVIITEETNFIKEISKEKISFEKEVDIKLFSISGKKISNLRNVNQISTCNIEKGWYVLEVNDNFGLRTKGKVFIY